MQREDVEDLCAPIEKIVNYEYSSRDALIHNCDLGAIDMGQLQDLCAALRALLAERDAAFAAGQSEMRERAAEALAGIALAMSKASTHPDADPERAQALVGICRVLAEAIRALPINPRP